MVGLEAGRLLRPGLLPRSDCSLPADRPGAACSFRCRAASTSTPRLALGAAAGLAAWTLLSILWTPTPAAALADAERVFAYTALFGLGLWGTRLLGKQMTAALLPVAIAGTLVGIATVVAIGTGSDFNWYLHSDATLRFPIGYRNANAAFFLTCLWPLIGLAAHNDWRWLAARGIGRRRDAAAGAGGARPEPRLAAGRGGRPAGHPDPLAAPVADGGSGRPRGAPGAARLCRPCSTSTATGPPIPGSCRSCTTRQGRSRLSTGARCCSPRWPSASSTRGFVSGRRGCGRSPGSPGLSRRSSCSPEEPLSSPSTAARSASSTSGSRSSARSAIPTCEARGSATEPTSAPTATTSGGSGSTRPSNEPLLGGGAGSFQLTYLEHRRSGESPRDPHSLIVRVASELGPARPHPARSPSWSAASARRFAPGAGARSPRPGRGCAGGRRAVVRAGLL